MAEQKKKQSLSLPKVSIDLEDPKSNVNVKEIEGDHCNTSLVLILSYIRRKCKTKNKQQYRRNHFPSS